LLIISYDHRRQLFSLRRAFVSYFTNASAKGPVRCIAIPWKIAVTASPREHKLIGVASKIGRTKKRVPVWSLKVRGADVPGRWIVTDGQFVELGDRGAYARQDPVETADRAIRMRPPLSIRGLVLLAVCLAPILAIYKIACWASRAFHR
jgi:hypothetical protein